MVLLQIPAARQKACRWHSMGTITGGTGEPLGALNLEEMRCAFALNSTVDDWSAVIVHWGHARPDLDEEAAESRAPSCNLKS